MQYSKLYLNRSGGALMYLFPFTLKFVFAEQSHRPGRRQVLEGHVVLVFSFMKFLSLKFKCEIISINLISGKGKVMKAGILI